MNYILYGNEKKLLDNKLETIKKKYNISNDNMNLVTYWCDETPIKEIIDDAITLPLFSEYKMIIIKNPLFMTTKKQKNITQEDIDLFINYTSHDNPTTILVIYHDHKDFDERKKVVKILKKNCEVYIGDSLTYKEIYRTVSLAFKKRNCKIDDDALDLLLSRVGNSLDNLSNEVDKLSLYSKHITVKDVNLLVARKVEENVYELTNAYLSKDMTSCISIYQDLIRNNEQPYGLIIMISNALRLLYQVKFLDRKGYNDTEISKLLSINPYRLRYIRKDGNRFDIKEILDNLEALCELDIGIKSGRINPYKGLELFLINNKE